MMMNQHEKDALDRWLTTEPEWRNDSEMDDEPDREDQDFWDEDETYERELDYRD